MDLHHYRCREAFWTDCAVHYNVFKNNGNCRRLVIAGLSPTVLQINGVETENKQMKQRELNTFSEVVFPFRPDDSSFCIHSKHNIIFRYEMHPAHLHTCSSLSSSFPHRTHWEMLFYRKYSFFNVKIIHSAESRKEIRILPPYPSRS